MRWTLADLWDLPLSYYDELVAMVEEEAERRA